MKKITKLLNLVNKLEANGKDSSTIKSALIKFFKENPNPSDDEVHGLADKLGVDAHDLEANIYSILSDLLKNTSEGYMKVLYDPSLEQPNNNLDLLLPIGKHNYIPDDYFDPRELETGIQVEHEHTDDKNIARAIAKDHLYECENYYTLLLQLEKECGIE